MKTLETKPFISLEDAVEFLNEEGCLNTKEASDQLWQNGYLQFRKYYIVIDPFGTITEPENDSFPLFQRLVFGFAIICIAIVVNLIIYGIYQHFHHAAAILP